MLAAAAGADAVVMAAAPADFRPTAVSEAKIKKADDGSAPTIELAQNPDILAELAHDRRGRARSWSGFAAETGDASGSVLDLARAKLARKGCDLLVRQRRQRGSGVRRRRQPGGDPGRRRVSRSTYPSGRRPLSPTSSGTTSPGDSVIETRILHPGLPVP